MARAVNRDPAEKAEHCVIHENDLRDSHGHGSCSGIRLPDLSVDSSRVRQTASQETML
jgi:hypothetical protein